VYYKDIIPYDCISKNHASYSCYSGENVLSYGGLTQLYHLVFPAKYRRAIFDETVEMALIGVCREIEKRYELKFLEIGTDKDHVHFLVQFVPLYSVTKLVKMIKSITAKEIFKQLPHVKTRGCPR
jgi:REP element-mobilizing transposase RayT